jgi:membrane glycosyltransferase
MTEPAPLTPALNLVGPGLSAPTGSQSMAILRRRRAFVIVVNLATYLALASWMAGILGAGGWTLVDILLFAGFLVATPWTCWASGTRSWASGSCISAATAWRRWRPLRLRATATSRFMPAPAILMTLRNEDPARAFRRLRIVKRSVDATGFGDRFAYFVLSDTSNADVAAAEERPSRPGALKARTPTPSSIAAAP